MTTPALATPHPRRADSLADLYAGVGDELREVEARLRQEIRARDPRIDAVVRQGYRLGGKRLRPALVLLAGQAAGGLREPHVLLATVVEMIHTATLVHDDVLDEADLRRHAPTINARWGNEASVLVGDFLFSHAFTLASQAGAEACRVIGRATNIVCEGELRQTLSAGDLELSEADYFAIIEAKTAELCACCCELGAREAGADEATVERLASFGRHLGIAFQIADDLLDLTGDAADTGKTAGADLAKSKMTLPMIQARDTLVNGPRTELLTRLQGGSTERAWVLGRLTELDTLAYARRRAEEHAAEACQLLRELPAHPAIDTLAAMARLTVNRQT